MSAKQIGTWSDSTKMYIRFLDGEIKICLDPLYSDPVWNYTVSGVVPTIQEVWAHSSASAPAFTSGSIAIDVYYDPSTSMTETFNAFMPLLMLMIGVAIVLAFFKYIAGALSKIF